MRIDLRAQHPLHHKRRIRVGVEVAAVVLAYQHAASLTNANGRGCVVEDVETVLHLARIDRAVDALREELAAKPQLLRDPLTRGERRENGGVAYGAVHAWRM